MKIDNMAKEARDAIKEKYSKEFAENFETAIKEYKEHGTTKSLAEELCVTPNTLGLYLKGEMLPTLANALAIADRFNLSLDDLFGRNNNLKELPVTPALSTIIKNIMALDEADVISLRMHPNKKGCFELSFVNDKINKFFYDYYMFIQEQRQKEGGEEYYQEWLKKEYDELDKETIELKKK